MDPMTELEPRAPDPYKEAAERVPIGDLLKEAFDHVSENLAGFIFWSIVGPLALFLFIWGIGHGLVPEIVRRQWLLDLTEKHGLQITLLMNTILYLFMSVYVLYEYVAPCKDDRGMMFCWKIQVIVLVAIDAYLAPFLPITKEVLLYYLAYWVICVLLLGIFLLYRTLFYGAFVPRRIK
jgi:hypothetical protein